MIFICQVLASGTYTSIPLQGATRILSSFCHDPRWHKLLPSLLRYYETCCLFLWALSSLLFLGHYVASLFLRALCSLLFICLGTMQPTISVFRHYAAGFFPLSRYYAICYLFLCVLLLSSIHWDSLSSLWFGYYETHHSFYHSFMLRNHTWATGIRNIFIICGSATHGFCYKCADKPCPT